MSRTRPRHPGPDPEDPPAPYAIATAACLAALTVTQLAAWLTLASLRMMAGGRLTAFDALAALFLAFLICARVTRTERKGWGPFVMASILLPLVWLAAITYALAFDDLSYDGQTYHALALLKLEGGWNPYRSQLLPDAPNLTWLNHYPKAPWLWAATLDATLGSFQASKATNVVTAVAAGLAVVRAASLARGAQSSTCLLLGLLAASNPVAVVQFPTLYVDGQLASLMTVMLAAGGTWVVRRSPLALLLTCASAVCLPNVKFTGAVYAALIALVLVSSFAVRWRKLSPLPLLACAFGVLGPGYAPYVDNVLRGDHVFHPVLGARKLDILSQVTPLALRGHSGLAKLAISLASETANACPSCPPAPLKWPFAVRVSEMKGATIPDARTGGFGPLFSAALALSFLLVGVGLFWRSVSAPLIVSLSLLAGLTLVNPESWWARFAPHLWLVPIAVLVMLPAHDVPRLWRAVRVALIGVVSLNVLFMGAISTGHALASTRRARAQASALARSGPLVVRPGPWVGAVQRLEEGGAALTERAFEPSQCRAVVSMEFADVQVCVPLRP